MFDISNSSCTLIRRVALFFSLVLSLGMTTQIKAQLNDCTLIDGGDSGSLPRGGCIAKSLNDQIGAGQGNESTPGSSIYLIKRDPARSIRRGRQLFQRKFTVAEGQGPRDNPASSGDIRQTRRLGAGTADSCAACHGRPRGSAGFGGDVVTRPDSRDAPHLFGLGLVEQLAEEITEELRSIRDQALVSAANGTAGSPVMDAAFDNSSDGFAFRQNVFGNADPRYIDNALVANSSGNRRAVIILGGLDGRPISNMSGGWERSFDLASAAEVQVSFTYRIIQEPHYESDEFTQAIVAVGNQQQIVDTLTGDGNNGPEMNTGIQSANMSFNLGAGTHTLTLGGFSNKKTAVNEQSYVSYDDVVVEVLGSAAGPVTADLNAKGISYGQITAFPDGTVDTSAVEGVDEDLRVRPFFHQGGTVTIREFIVGAFKDEMGLEVADPILCSVTDPNNAQAATSPAGFQFDPSQDTFERPPVCVASDDGDNDGVANEIDPALLDHMEFYLLNYFKPGQYKVTSNAQTGLQLMEQIGCTGCHVQDLTIDSDRRVADIETVYDPVNGIFNELFATASTLFTAVDDGDAFPQLVPQNEPFVVRNFFSDLKRHDLGPAFHEREWDGSVVTEFVTEPLWGVGSSAPYGHDGRSINLDSVIRRHGGEAQSAKQAYEGLSASQQLQIQDFLQTLILFPPDDTASDLNPGNKGDTAGIQDPSAHGSIDLSQLFQIPAEGGE